MFWKMDVDSAEEQENLLLRLVSDDNYNACHTSNANVSTAKYVHVL